MDKILKGRVKIDCRTILEWEQANPVAQKGEIMIVESSTTGEDSTSNYLVKIGDGVTHFHDLPYISALSADVYPWALSPTKPTYTAAEIETSLGYKPLSSTDITDLNSKVYELIIPMLNTIIDDYATKLYVDQKISEIDIGNGTIVPPTSIENITGLKDALNKKINFYNLETEDEFTNFSTTAEYPCIVRFGFENTTIHINDLWVMADADTTVMIFNSDFFANTIKETILSEINSKNYLTIQAAGELGYKTIYLKDKAITQSILQTNTNCSLSGTTGEITTVYNNTNVSDYIEITEDCKVTGYTTYKTMDQVAIALYDTDHNFIKAYQSENLVAENCYSVTKEVLKDECKYVRISSRPPKNKWGTIQVSLSMKEKLDTMELSLQEYADTVYTDSTGYTDSEITKVNKKITTVHTNINSINSKISSINTNIDNINTNITTINSSITSLNNKDTELENLVTQNSNSITGINNKNTEQDNKLTQLEKNVNSIFNQIYPINSIIMFNDDKNHSNFLGFTWQRCLENKVPLGYLDGSVVRPIGTTLGEETHRLTTAEVPQLKGRNSLGIVNDSGDDDFAGPNYASNEAPSPHNIMQPSQVIAFWVRIA